jgi:hypothetical protein
MGLYANLPVALAPGMGQNAFFAFTVVPLLAGDWRLALGCVFVAGILFVVTANAANPDSFLPQITFFAYTILILGGAATTFGPILGSVIFWFLVSGTDSLLREAAGAGLLPQFMVTGDAIGASRFVLVGAGLMLLMVETPGVSHLFGCRPIGPVGLGIAALSSALATGASLVAPPIVELVRVHLARRRSEREEPDPGVEIKLGPPEPGASEQGA